MFKPTNPLFITAL